MRSKFLDIKKKSKSGYTIFSLINEWGSFNESEAREYEGECIEDEEETDASTHFLRIQKNQLIDLMQHLERYTNTLPVFGFNSGRYDINLIKSNLILYFINGRKMNLHLSRKQTNLFPANLEMLSYWTLWCCWLERLFSKSLKSQWDERILSIRVVWYSQQNWLTTTTLACWILHQTEE